MSAKRLLRPVTMRARMAYIRTTVTAVVEKPAEEDDEHGHGHHHH